MVEFRQKKAEKAEMTQISKVHFSKKKAKINTLQKSVISAFSAFFCLNYNIVFCYSKIMYYLLFIPQFLQYS